MSSDFPENSKNCQDHDIFEVAVMGRCIYPCRRFWSRILRNSSEICFPKEIMCLSIIYCRQLKFFRKFSGDPLEIPFLPNDKFGVKRPQLSKNKKLDP